MVFPAGITKPRILLIGDSISAGPGCYKKHLVQNLRDHRITNFEFVGDYPDDCGGDVRHGAVSCAHTADYTEVSFTRPRCFPDKRFPGLRPLMEAHHPDLVLVQLGVNDIWSGNTPVESVLRHYAKLVEQARAHNPRVVLVFAQIHKIITDDCKNAASAENARALVEAVPGWARQVSTRESPVLTADLWTNSDPHEAHDCVHPDEAGAKRMGLNWYNALKNILR